jgi:hypothetical protein
MSAQPIALWLADKLEDMPADGHWLTANNAAAELRRLYQLAQEQHTEIYGLRLEVRNLLDTLKRLREMCADFGAKTACDIANAAIARSTGETK